MSRRLIVTADDFGASLAINEAVEQAHREGILTAASLLIGAEHATDAIERARRLPNLAVGLHVALTNARAVLPRERVADLVDERGNFSVRTASAGVRYFFSAAARREIEAEVRAQFEAYVATDLELDHVDAHNHMHVHPTILTTILRVGSEFGMRAMRAPFEPWRATPAGIANALLVGPWALLLRRRLRRYGLATNDAVFGLNDTGRLDEHRVIGILSRLPEGLSELYCHPAQRRSAYGETERATAAAYARREELDALLSPRVRAALVERDVVLTTYGNG